MTRLHQLHQLCSNALAVIFQFFTGFPTSPMDLSHLEAFGLTGFHLQLLAESHVLVASRDFRGKLMEFTGLLGPNAWELREES